MIKIGVNVMKVKIAVFGTWDTIQRLKQLMAKREEIEILPFIYSKAEETIDLIEKVFTCDFYLFTNPIAYLYVKEKVEKKRLLAIHADYDPYTIASSFYQMQIETGNTLKRIGMDVTAVDNVNELQNRLQLEKQAISYFLFDPLETPDPAKLVSYYEHLWENDEIEYVLTSLDEVANALLEKDIPSRTITLPNYNLLNDVKKGVELTELNQAQNKQ